MVGILYYSGIVVRKMGSSGIWQKAAGSIYQKEESATVWYYPWSENAGITRLPDMCRHWMTAWSKTRKAEAIPGINSEEIVEMMELITLLFNYVKLGQRRIWSEKGTDQYHRTCPSACGRCVYRYGRGRDDSWYDIPEEADYAEIDKMQFSRAFTNLLMNAIKHNEAGTSIKISMKKQLSYLVIKVMDSGERIDLARYLSIRTSLLSLSGTGKPERTWFRPVGMHDVAIFGIASQDIGNDLTECLGKDSPCRCLLSRYEHLLRSGYTA